MALKFPEGMRAILASSFSNINSKTDTGHGSQADSQTYEGVTALHLTSVYSFIECSEVLLEGGARHCLPRLMG